MLPEEEEKVDYNDILRAAEAKRAEAETLLIKAQVSDEDEAKATALLDESKKLRARAAKIAEVRGMASHVPPLDDIQAKREKEGKPFTSFGEYLQAVRAASGSTPQVDKRLYSIKAQLGLNEGIPSEGGFLVQTDHVTELLRKVYELGALASRVRKLPVSANANGLTINAVAETSRATGSRWGGVQAYWLHEAGTKTPTDPEFRQMQLRLKKLIGLCYSTDELLQDTTALESVIMQAFSEEFAWMVDNAIYRGAGVGQPVGITGHASTVVVPAEAGQVATEILPRNIQNMYSRMWARSRSNAVWVINQDVEPALHSMVQTVGVGGSVAYMPAGGLSASPFATLYGLPVIPIEQASTLGTVGDIALIDLSQYLMIDKGGMQSAQSIHVAFTTDQSAFRFVYRCDGQPTWNTVLTPANGTNTLSPFVQLATR